MNNITLKIKAEDFKKKLGLKDGAPGKDYVLTDKDRKDIASKIEPRTLEKIIEKTEVIREIPNEETGEEIVDKVNGSIKKIKPKAIEGLPALINSIDAITKYPVGKEGGGGPTYRISNAGTKVSDFVTELDFNSGVSATYTENGKVSITGAASGTWGSITGTLSDQTDLQTALNAKQNAGTYVTGATDTTLTLTGTTLGVNEGYAHVWTANQTISKALPEFKQTTTGDNNYTRVTRTTGGLSTRYNQSSTIGTGYGINLTGSNGTTTTSSATLNALTVFTVSMWVKLTTSSNSNAFLFSKYNSSDATAKVQVLRNGSSYSVRMGGLTTYNGSATIFDNTWRHFVITYDGATGVEKTYVNGTLDINQTNGTTPYTGAGSLYIGHRQNNFFAVGTIDEVKVDDAAWSQAQVTADYNAGAGVYGTAGSGYVIGLHYDQALTDYSGNSYSTAWQGSSSYTTGLILQAGTAGVNEINIWNSKDGTVINEYGITTFGDLNAQTIFDGLRTVFKVNGTEKARFEANGFLGIGTTTPIAPLTLNSVGAAVLSIQNSGTNTLTLDATGQLTVNSGTFVLSNGSTTVMQLTAGGKVNFPYNFSVSASDAITTIASGLSVSARTTGTVGLSVAGIASQTFDIFQVLNSGGTILTKTEAGGKFGVGMGATALSAQLQVQSTTEQQRWNYDASNYANITVGSTGAVTFDATGSGASFTFNDAIINTLPIRLKGYTVAGLPAGTVGDTAYVTDALAPTFLATLVGGGAIVTPCFYNGSAWVSY